MSYLSNIVESASSGKSFMTDNALNICSGVSYLSAGVIVAKKVTEAARLSYHKLRESFANEKGKEYFTKAIAPSKPIVAD